MAAALQEARTKFTCNVLVKVVVARESERERERESESARARDRERVRDRQGRTTKQACLALRVHDIAPAKARPGESQIPAVGCGSGL